MNDELNDMIQISCEETIPPDIEAQLEMTEQASAIPEGYELDPVWGPINGALRPLQPTHKEVTSVCEDAPCCGCCGGSIEDGDAFHLGADAWHDANEYPDW